MIVDRILKLLDGVSPRCGTLAAACTPPPCKFAVVVSSILAAEALVFVRFPQSGDLQAQFLVTLELQDILMLKILLSGEIIQILVKCGFMLIIHL